jgi:hypothetical protein
VSLRGKDWDGVWSVESTWGIATYNLDSGLHLSRMGVLDGAAGNSDLVLFAG